MGSNSRSELERIEALIQSGHYDKAEALINASHVWNKKILQERIDTLRRTQPNPVDPQKSRRRKRVLIVLLLIVGITVIGVLLFRDAFILAVAFGFSVVFSVMVHGARRRRGLPAIVGGRRR